MLVYMRKEYLQKKSLLTPHNGGRHPNTRERAKERSLRLPAPAARALGSL